MSRIVLWNNLIALATVTVTSEAAGFEKERAYNGFASDGWKPLAAGTVYYTLDFGAPVSVDCWGAFGHDLGNNAATIKLQYSTDNFAADTNDFGTAVSPTAGEPFLRVGASLSKRYWRFEVVSATAASTIGGLMLGVAMVPDSALDTGHEPDYMKPRYTTKTNINGNGINYGVSAYKKPVTGSIDWGLLERSWVDANWLPFVRHAELGKGFLYAPDSANNPAEVTYAQMDKSKATAKYSHATLMSATMNYIGIAD